MKVPGEMSEQAFNEMKNKYMAELAWKMQENGVSELVNAPAHLALDTNATGYKQALNFLVRHGICERADGPAIVHNLAQVKAGTLDPTKLPSDMQRKMAEYCYMFLHKDPSQGVENALLKSSFHDEWIKDAAGSVKDFTRGGHHRWNKVKNVMTAVGIPVFANTFLEDVNAEPRKEKTKKSLIDKMRDKIPGRKKNEEDERDPDIIVDPRKMRLMHLG